MIIGDSSLFAIESKISQSFRRISLRALGYFLIYVCGNCYGVREPEATMLACSFDEVKQRIANRGRHIASFVEFDARQIVDAFYSALYAEEQEESYFGIKLSKFRRYFDRNANDLLWAPDGDAAFDDGSYVMQFDLKDRVRLIAFKINEEGCLPETLSEVWLSANEFYLTLQEWCDSFEAEWKKHVGLSSN